MNRTATTRLSAWVEEGLKADAYSRCGELEIESFNLLQVPFHCHVALSFSTSNILFAVIRVPFFHAFRLSSSSMVYYISGMCP